MELCAIANFYGVPIGVIFILPCCDEPEQVEGKIHGKAQGLDPQAAEKDHEGKEKAHDGDDEKEAELEDDGLIDATDEGNGKIHAVA